MALSGMKKHKAKNDSSEASASDSDANSQAEGNAGWASSIAKVLNTTKPKSKKILVLSRAKKTKPDEKTKTKNYDFEIEGEIKEEKPDKELLDIDVKPRKNVPLQLRTKPTWKDMERERTLRKIAQRGVVQLFNAVRIQQKDLQEQLEEAGPLDSRREAVLKNINKRKFLDVLMGGNRAKSQAVDNDLKKEEEESNDDEEDSNKKGWDVLRPDFLTSKRVKHWDQEDDEDDSDNNRVQSNDESSEDE